MRVHIKFIENLIWQAEHKHDSENHPMHIFAYFRHCAVDLGGAYDP